MSKTSGSDYVYQSNILHGHREVSLFREIYTSHRRSGHQVNYIIEMMEISQSILNAQNIGLPVYLCLNKGTRLDVEPYRLIHGLPRLKRYPIKVPYCFRDLIYDYACMIGVKLLPPLHDVLTPNDMELVISSMWTLYLDCLRHVVFNGAILYVEGCKDRMQLTMGSAHIVWDIIQYDRRILLSA